MFVGFVIWAVAGWISGRKKEFIFTTQCRPRDQENDTDCLGNLLSIVPIYCENLHCGNKQGLND